MHVRKNIDGLGETVKDVKDASGEASDANETHVTRCWRKGNLVAKWQRIGLNCVLVW